MLDKAMLLLTASGIVGSLLLWVWYATVLVPRVADAGYPELAFVMLLGPPVGLALATLRLIGGSQ